jgi:hypothetical protein
MPEATQQQAAKIHGHLSLPQHRLASIVKLGNTAVILRRVAWTATLEAMLMTRRRSASLVQLGTTITTITLVQHAPVAVKDHIAQPGRHRHAIAQQALPAIMQQIQYAMFNAPSENTLVTGSPYAMIALEARWIMTPIQEQNA